MMPPPMMTISAWLGILLTRWVLLPGQGIGLQVGKAFHGLEHAFSVAQARILDAAEGRHLDAIARHFPDIHRADLELLDETGDVVEAVGANPRGEAVGRGIGNTDGLLDIRNTNDRRDWAKSLVMNQARVIGHMVQHGRRVKRTLALVAIKQLGSVPYRLVHRILA